jgi:hypothetical protein
MKILCILQNQWADNHDQILALHAKHPGRRNEIITRMLFRGSLTGQRIEMVFGDLMEQHAFIFDEASTVVTPSSKGNPPYNANHVRETITRVQPDAVITFGSSSRRAVEDVRKAKRLKIDLPPVIECVHPAIQKPTWMRQMLATKAALKEIIKRLQPV